MKYLMPNGDPIEKFHLCYKKDEETGCWVWQKTINAFGYARHHFNGSSVMAHRFSYEIHKGKVGKFYVCHKCDNTKCVNPDHLFLGTQKENMKDCIGKGRFCVRDKRPQAKLKSTDIQTIKNLYNSEKLTQKEIANVYKVSRQLIGDILNEKRWA